MSLTIHEALHIGYAFRGENLQENVSGKGDCFNKEYIKHLSSADRKVCYRALSLIEKARLSDFEGSAADLSDRVKDVTTAISVPIKSKDKEKSAWYEKPFIGVAKLVHSFCLGFKNTFFGRISSVKLLNKVETYLNDLRLAHIRIEELNKESDGDICKAKEMLKTRAAEQRKFLEGFQILVDARETLHFIDVIAPKDKNAKVPGLENFRADIRNTWIIDDINADVIDVCNLKEVVENRIDDATEDEKKYLDELFKAAQSEEDNIGEIPGLIEEAVKKLQEDLKAQAVIGDEKCTNVKNANDHLKKLKDELNLLNQKYPK